MQNCLICGKDITDKRQGSKTCSPKCRVTLNRQEDNNRGSVTDIPPKKSKDVTHKLTKINALLAAKGLPPVIRASELPPITFVTSGIEEIDKLTGGFPRKRITEIFGLKGVGKTALMTRIVNSVSLRVFYIDTEAALVQVPDNVEILNQYLIEEIEDAVEAALQDNYDLIVIDSVASMIPRAEVEGDPGDMHMGLKARLMSQWMRRINYHMRDSSAAVVFINQQRESMNPYGPSKFTPGGFALGYAASLRLELRTTKADRILKDKEVIGHTVKVEIEKSRVCKPYQKTEFKLIYN